MKFIEFVDYVIRGVTPIDADKQQQDYDLTRVLNAIKFDGWGLYNPVNVLSCNCEDFYKESPYFNTFVNNSTAEFREKTGCSIKEIKTAFYYAANSLTYTPEFDATVMFYIQCIREEFPKYSPNTLIKALPQHIYDIILKKPSTMSKLVQVLNKLFGYEVTLIDKSRGYAVNGDFVEFYVENIDDVVTCKKEVLSFIDVDKDVRSLSYVPESGIVVGGSTPLRIIAGQFGITTNDLDLTEVV